MRCSKCGAENLDRAKFCVECASPFPRRCSSCNAENPPNAKFCLECARPLDGTRKSQPASPQASSPIKVSGGAGDSSLDGERKTVTALFADIKGSTDLMQDLDPEEARAIVDPVLKLMIDAVRRYEGYLVRTTGDGVFALFGAPTAYEDHPQRAVYAALQMQQELRTHGQKSGVKGPRALEARVGIHTGEVVAYAGEASGKVEYRLMGHTANLASRMESIAPSGSIAMSETTAKLCEGYFELHDLGPAAVKGISRPLDVYEVLRPGVLRTHFEVLARHGLTRFVGRQDELEQLALILEKAKAGYGQIVAALGEAGVGKSRLFHEFKARAKFECSILEAYALSYAKPSAYLPVIELLRNYFEIASEDDRRQGREKRIAKLLALDSSHVFSFWRRRAREKVWAKVSALDARLQDTLPFLFSVLGIQEPSDPLLRMDPEIRRGRTLDAIKRILLHDSLERPLVLIFEDLHWIDAETQSLLNALANSIAHRPVLLLVNYRPEYQHEWTNKSYYTQLRLEPLSADRAEEMLTTLLSGDPELAILKRKIIARAEGNPFFIEEIVQALFEEGALVRNGSVKVKRSPLELRLPATVNGILAARIDRLSLEHKELLQTVAAIGRESPLYLIRQLRAGAEAELERILSDLQAAEFLHEKSVAGGAVYVFKHSLTLDVAYNSMLIERRKSLHAKIARVLESLHADKLDNYVSELAHHYDRSGNRRKAVEYLGRAGNWMAQQAAHSEAVGYLTRAVVVVKQLADGEDRDRQELDLQIALGRSLIAVKGWPAPERETVLVRAQELGQRLMDNSKLTEVLLDLAFFRLYSHESNQARQLAQRALVLAEQIDAQAMIAAAHCLLGIFCFGKGELETARHHLERADEIFSTRRYRDSNEALYARMAIGGLFSTLLLLGYPEAAERKSDQMLTVVPQRSDPYSIADALLLDANGRLLLRDEAVIVDRTRELHSLAVEHGMPFRLARTDFLGGWLMVALGRPNEGIKQMRRAIADLKASGVTIGIMTVALADAYAKHGNVEEALGTVAEGLTRGDLNTVVEAELYRLKGQLLLMQDPGSTEEAERYFHTAIDIARRQHARLFELRATGSLALLMANRGRRDEACAMLGDIYNWFTEGFDSVDLKGAKALLDQLSR